MAAQVGIAGSARVGNGCMFGGQVGIGGHISVGDNVQLGAQSGVASNIRDGQTLLGSPAYDVKKFARNVVYQKNIGSLYDRVKELEKIIKEK